MLYQVRSRHSGNNWKCFIQQYLCRTTTEWFSIRNILVPLIELLLCCILGEKEIEGAREREGEREATGVRVR